MLRLSLYFSCHFQRKFPDHADNPSKKKRRGSVALTGLSDGDDPRCTRHRFAHAVLSGANRKKKTPAWVSYSPVHDQTHTNSPTKRIVVRLCCSCLVATFTFFSCQLQRKLPEYADDPSKKKATRKRGLHWAFRWSIPTAYTSPFAGAVLSGANRKSSSPAWVLCSPVHKQRLANSRRSYFTAVLLCLSSCCAWSGCP